MSDPEFIKDVQDQMEALEFEIDTFEHSHQYPSDTKRFVNLVREHADLEDILNLLLDDDGHTHHDDI